MSDTRQPCEDAPHDYGPDDMVKSPAKNTVTSTRTCKVCKTVRILVMDLISGEVLSRHYEYPKPE